MAKATKKMTKKTSKDDNLDAIVNEWKEKNKVLENDKAELTADLDTLKDANVDLKIQLKEVNQLIIDANDASTIKEHDIDNLMADIKKLTDDNTALEMQWKELDQLVTELKCSMPEDAIVSDEYKYNVDDFVCVPSKYQKMAFRVTHQIGIGVQGPIYNLYQHDGEFSISNISEYELISSRQLFAK